MRKILISLLIFVLISPSVLSVGENEITIFSQELAEEIKDKATLSTENFEGVLKEDIKNLKGELILLIPRNKYFLIRDFIRYDYSEGVLREFILINNVNIEIHDYIDRNNINSVFLFSKNSIKWKTELSPIYKPAENLGIELETMPARIRFVGYLEASENDKKYLTEKELVIITKFGHNVKIDKDKVKRYSLEEASK